MARTRAKRDTKSAAITGADVFLAVVAMAREAGDLSKAEHIFEFCRPCAHGRIADELAPITSLQFDFVPQISFGTNEGMFLDCYLCGRFDDSGRHSICIGSMRTLSKNMDTCKILGELSGALMYHARLYITAQERRMQGPEHMAGSYDPLQPARDNHSAPQTPAPLVGASV